MSEAPLIVEVLLEPVRIPSCEHCGCTEAQACTGGCSWSPFFRRQGRWVCSQCVKVVREAEVDRG